MLVITSAFFIVNIILNNFAIISILCFRVSPVMHSRGNIMCVSIECVKAFDERIFGATLCRDYCAEN